MNEQMATIKGTLPLNAGLVSVGIAEMPRDMRRMLRVQWKEFLHHMEDAQIGLELDGRVIQCRLSENDRAA